MTKHRNSIFTFLVVLFASACSGGGGCGGCGFEPLPEGGLPSDQTIEGGAQLRISDTGFSTITQIIPAIIQDSFAEGTCVPEGGGNITVLGVNVAGADYCFNNDGSCTDGCEVDLNVDSIDLFVPQDDQLAVGMQFDVSVDIPLQVDVFGGSIADCTVVASANNVAIDLILDFGIDPTTGELSLELLDIPTLDLNLNLDASDCNGVVSFLADALELVSDALTGVLGIDFIRDLLTPVLEPIVAGLLPDPLGFEGVADLSGFVGEISPGTNASMETRIVPGGYVHLERGGLSLGIITGINADEDPSTRSANLDSEPALCVPPFVAPDFSAAPASLTQNARQNFVLNPADLFRGLPETSDDVVFGASETMLDQLGHHLVSSGAFCLSLGSELLPQLNLGAIGILVPSLAELGSEEGDDAILLVTRPAKPIDFTIGDGTEASPSLTMHLEEFSIDFYAFLFERYTRGFTVTLDMNIGINFEFGTNSDGAPTLSPILVGLEADNIGVTITNEEFLREDATSLEAVFPSLLDLILPLVTAGLDSFALPEVAGFQMDNLLVSRVTTSEDDFLAIQAGLSAGSTFAALAPHYPSVAVLAEEYAATTGIAAQADVKFLGLENPSPNEARAQLLSAAGGVAPAAKFEVASHDIYGRELEWTYRLNGGMWHSFQKGKSITVADRAFFIQGRYDIDLKARAVGEAKSWEEEAHSFHVVFDSVAPHILPSSVERDEAGLHLSAYDNVYGDDVEVAFASPGALEPATAWGKGLISNDALAELLVEGQVTVFTRDPKGNKSSETIRVSAPILAQAGGCQSSGSQGGLLLLLVLVGLYKIGRKAGPRAFAPLCLLLGIAAAPACNCSGDPGGAVCSIDEDCIGLCDEGQVGQCFDEQCRCLGDVPTGRIGQFSSMAVATDGTVWVSGYNSLHGDLMVAGHRGAGRIPDETWEYVDGVPDGPIVLPAGSHRFGIQAEGPDVGLYTDIAVAGGVVMVSYFDTSTGSLKFAANYDGQWSSHVVEAGDLSTDDTAATKISGQYSSISLDASGVPSIAYFAHTGIGGGEARTEVRLATAISASPRASGDWAVQEVDGEDVLASETENDVLKIPFGTGLFIDMTRDMADEPIMAYYDRVNGDLKLAKWAADPGAFAISTLAEEGDVGWYPSVTVDENDVAHVSYVDVTNRDLLYLNTADLEVKTVDDGYRLVGTTQDGLPIPEFHFVGDDSSVVLGTDDLFISYQDATTHELLVAFLNEEGNFGRVTIAGAEDPFEGAYGFFANAEFDGTDLVLSSWALDQGSSSAWVEIFKRSVVIE